MPLQANAQAEAEAGAATQDGGKPAMNRYVAPEAPQAEGTQVPGRFETSPPPPLTLPTAVKDDCTQPLEEPPAATNQVFPAQVHISR